MENPTQKTIDLDDFVKTTVKVKLGKFEFILRKPSVNQFLVILSKTQNIGKDYQKDTQSMIDILCMLVKNRGFLGWRVLYLRMILGNLDEGQLLTVWDNCFLVLGVVESPTQRAEQESNPS